MNTRFSRVCISGLAGMLLSFCSATAQVVINEICPSNISLIVNSNGKYDDWIELYNSGGSSVNLSGYGLSDDAAKPYLFTFPSYSLGAGKRILVFASDTNSSVVVDHWEMPVNATGTWKYYAGSAAPDTNWRNTSFNDASWSSGAGGIGFGDGDDGTSVGVTVTVAMRKTFSVPDTSEILKAVLMMDYDDGFVAYLNGREVARANIATATPRPGWSELALSGHDAQGYQGLPLDSFFIDVNTLRAAIRPGNNVLAIETHNVTASSSDLSSIPYLFFGMKSSGSTFASKPSWFHVPAKEYFNAAFKLSRSGETVYLTNSSSSTIDQKTYTAFGTDNSFGRKPDGTSSWCYFGTPTPDASNNSSTCYNGYASIPLFSVSGGFYASTRTVTLSSSTPGAVIRYTTNGDEPTSSDPSYSSAITVSSTKTLRARVFASGYLPSPVVTNTYFINEDTHLPVFTITTDSLNLWDWNTGIYVMGPNAGTTSPYFGANFWEDWQKPATIEYYDKAKNRILRFDAEIEIYGNYSRAKPQKSFEIKLSDKYGTGDVSYAFWPDKPFIDDDIDDIILRNSGTDWNKVHFRDALMERLMRNTYSGYLTAEPAEMYLNGQYWGVYTIHENHDENWMNYNYGLKKSQIDYFKEDGTTITLKEGNDAGWWAMYNYATSQTPNTQTYYDYMNSVLDLKNYADYFICETYVNNGDWIGDWTNNIKFWRPNAPGSKFRYLLYDTDFGFGLQGDVNDNRLSMARNPAAFSHSSEMFDAMLNNSTFKRYFINRYADLINTIWLPSNVDDVMHQFQDSMSSDMPMHFAKWGGSMSTWQDYLDDMMDFVNARPNIVRNQIKSLFSLTGKVTLTLNVSPAGAGRIEISTITPTTYPWSGVYFNGNPVTITAIPNPGYSFNHFRSNVVINSNNYNQSVTYNFTANDQITAYFTGSPATPLLTVSEFNYNSDDALDAGDWVELHNYGSAAVDISGWKLNDEQDNHFFRFPTGTVLNAGAYLVIVEDTAKFRSQFPLVTNFMGPTGFNWGDGGDMVRLFDYMDNLYLSFTYQDASPWPTLADGDGYTCELQNPSGNLNSGSNWFSGCIGGSPGQAYSPLLSIPVSISGNTTFCTGGSVSLSATSDPSYSYQWKKNGTNISGATNNSYTATQAGTYTVLVTKSGCSVVSDPVTVNVVTQGPDPVTTSSYRCGPGDLTLTASSTDTIFWYDAASGGNLVGTGDSLATGVLNNTTTYYAITSTVCPSNPVAATAEILAITAAPVTSDVSRCGPGIVTLTASDTAEIHWYNLGSGGALLQTGSSFTTNSIPHDSVFYVEAGNICPSPRIEVNVTINSTPAPTGIPSSRCGSGTVTLGASGTGTLLWYNVSSGGSSIGTGSSFTTPSLTQTDTFYVEANSGCPSSRIPVIAIVNTIPQAPTASDTTLCTSGSATLTAISSESITWYDAPVNGNVLGTGSNYTTPVINSTTTYYAEAGYDCPSPRTAVQVIISGPPAAPTAGNVSRCGPGTVVLTGSSPLQISWYDAASGGTLLGTGSSYTTPSITTTTTYYLEAGTDCRSNRISVQAIVNPIPSPPAASDGSRCGPGTVTLTASSPEQIFWFSGASGGTALGTGSSYTTPSISTTTTYYVETGNTCRSNRIPVQAIIEVTPAPPTTSSASRCGTGTVTLTASAPQQIYWYDAATGGTLLFTGSAFTTPSISATTTYYAETGNTCRSNRVAVQAIVNPIPSPPAASNVSRCGPGTVTLTATSTEQIYWYSAASGGILLGTGNSYTTPSISSTTTYYVETGNTCRSSRISVQAVINSIPAAPTAPDVSRCGPGTVTLTATSPEQIYWFSGASGGTPLATGTSYTTPSISVTTTYYVETGNTCRSNRIAVQAIISSPPAPPVLTDGLRCGPGTVVLTAVSSSQVNWYNVSTGGTALGTGLSFTTPVISTTTTFYADAGSGCNSSRVPVQAIVNSIPAAPAGTGASRCGPGSVMLSASSPDVVTWYTVSSGGTPLTTGYTYTTPSLPATTTFYAEAGTTCRSTRTGVTATINPLPSPPVASDVSRCGSGSVTLTATSPEQIYWYTTAGGGTPVGTGTSYVTPSLSASTTYYVEAGNSCRSNRIPVQAIITTQPAPPVVTDGERCGPGTVILGAASSSQVNWYTSSSGGTPVDTGLSFTTPSISTTTTYYADAGLGCNSARVPVVATIKAIPNPPSAPDAARCGPGTVTLNGSSSQQIYWYDTPVGGTALDSGSVFTTPSITSTTLFYLETGDDCMSNRVSVQAIIRPVPAPPVSSDVSRCGSGMVTLNATSTEQIRWYAASSGGSPLATGASFTTPYLAVTTTYYVETGNDCASNRIAVQAIITTVPSVPVVTDGSRCGQGTVVLTATSSTQVNWYDAPTGGTLLGTGLSFVTPSLTTTTTFYASAGLGCNSATVPVTATVIPAPAPPTTTDGTRCGTGSVLLTASSPETIMWYDSLTGGTLQFTGQNFNTPSISATTTYYAEANDGCGSTRIPAIAEIRPVPADPVTSDVSRCGPGTIVLSATSPEQIYWYDASSGGTLLGTGSSFTTPSLSSNTTYYVEAGDDCRSQRIAVEAIITSTPATPSVTDGSRCGPGSVSLSATSSTQVNWFDDATGSNLLGTGLTFSTPPISTTTTFFASAGLGCNSALVPVLAEVLPLPDPPVITDGSRCGPGTVDLTAISPEAVYWYSDSLGTNLVGSDTIFTTPVLNVSTTYYVETGDNCRSILTEVHAIIDSASVITGTISGSSCGPGSVVLYASSVDSVHWYDAPGGNLLGSDTVLITPVIGATTQFYAVAGTSCPGAPVAVTATIHPLPQVNLGPDTISLTSGQSIVLDAGPGWVSYLWSTGDTSQTYTASTDGFISVTVTDSNYCSGTDTVFINILTLAGVNGKSINLEVFPNPTHDKVTLRWTGTNAGDFLLRLFASDGKLVSERYGHTGNMQHIENIFMNEYAPGIYYLHLEADDYTATIRIILQ